jgi:hypothetical protein
VQAYYLLQAGVQPSAADNARAIALGLVGPDGSTPEIIIGDPTGQVDFYPSVIVMSSALATVIIRDDSGQATLAEVQAAIAVANTAEATVVSNKTALLSRANAALTVNQAFLNLANPDQDQALAQVTALTRQVDALIYLVLDVLNDISGT